MTSRRGDPERHVFARDRGAYSYPRGYFDHMIGSRIPFPGEHGEALAGELVTVVETSNAIEMWLADVGPES